MIDTFQTGQMWGITKHETKCKNKILRHPITAISAMANRHGPGRLNSQDAIRKGPVNPIWQIGNIEL